MTARHRVSGDQEQRATSEDASSKLLRLPISRRAWLFRGAARGPGAGDGLPRRCARAAPHVVMERILTVEASGKGSRQFAGTAEPNR